AYGHVLVPADRKGAKPVEVTPNDSRLTRSGLPWMSRPWSFLPNWATGCKPAPGLDPGGHGYWVEYNPVAYAYRTVGLVRGEHPYVLIVDDIRKDDAKHLYEWLMQVPDGLTLTRAPDAKTPKGSVVDLVLADERGRRLLLRVLAAGADAAEAQLTRAESRLETYEKEARGRTSRHRRIVLPLRATTGTYKVLLLPYRDGRKLPATTWSKDRAKLTVAWQDQTDEYTFAVGGDGRTRLALSRGGRRVLEME
ncbi:MAG: hypothetical protein WBF17_00430, partial [Phycisphaerae bacterium]